MAGPILLDGSEGEGGGQILRTALSLSLITGQPFCIQRIRAHRSPKGLRPQHLACIRGAEALSGGFAEGASVGSEAISFRPAPVKPGDYLLEVGTAGSTPLLLQCLYYPLALAGGGTVTLRGGTHVPYSPTFDYAARVWLPMLSRYGLKGELHLRYAGFYPEGNGQIRAVVPKRDEPPPSVDLSSRGTLKDVDVASMVAQLRLDIAERQARSAVARLRESGIHAMAENLPLPSKGSTGTAVFIRAEFERSVAGFCALGEKGRPAEEVGREAAGKLADFMRGAGAVDAHMGDQILLPAALLAAGILGEKGPTRFTTQTVTSHLRTNAAVIERFLPVRIEVGEGGSVSVSPG